jgi:hypothetical protein
MAMAMALAMAMAMAMALAMAMTMAMVMAMAMAMAMVMTMALAMAMVMVMAMALAMALAMDNIPSLPDDVVRDCLLHGIRLYAIMDWGRAIQAATVEQMRAWYEGQQAMEKAKDKP